jgi:hypothetical protein
MKRNAGLDVAEAEGPRPCSVGREGGIIRGKDRRCGNDDVELHVGNDAPVEFDGGAARIDLDGSAVRRRKCAEFVVAKVEGLGIVSLKRRTGACNNDTDKSKGKKKE